MTFPKAVSRDAGEENKWRSLAAGRLDFLFSTRVLPCPYLPARHERKIVAELADDGAAHDYERLIRAGYRRSGPIAYRHACPACRACSGTSDSWRRSGRVSPCCGSTSHATSSTSHATYSISNEYGNATYPVPGLSVTAPD